MQQQTEFIWTEFHTQLKHFILGRISDKSLADDILQDVFLKVHTHIESFKQNDNIKNWLYRITRNTIIDYYRTHKTTESLPATLAAPESDEIENARQEIGACLLPMIEQLPEHYRQAIRLSEIEGLSQKEVARQQQLSLSGAKSRVQRGRGMVKKLLTKCCQFEFDHHKKVINYEEKTAGSRTGCGSCETPKNACQHPCSPTP